MRAPRHRTIGIDEARAARHCACLNLRKAARTVTQLYDEVLRPSGLRATQYALLATLRARGSTTVKGLADALVMDRTTLTRNLRPLERDGLIRRRPGDDLRVRELSLTARGQRALDRAFPLWRRAQRRLAERLGAYRMEHLLSDLRATVLHARR